MNTDFGDIPLKGIIPPLVTPLADHDVLDVGGLERVIEHVIAGGVHGIFILGTTGEGPGLSHRLQRDVVQQTCRLVDSRVPVLVGITDTSVVESISLAEFSADKGADGVVLATPYYFPANQQEVADYTTSVANSISLPTFLYNMPSHTKLSFEIETVRRLMQLPRIVGIKDSSGNMMYYNRLLELANERPGFTVLMGPEELTAQSVLMGGHGGVCGGANLVPKLFVRQYEAAISEDWELVRELQKDVVGLAHHIYSIVTPPSSYVRALKAALADLGLCSELMEIPFSPLSESDRARVAQAVEAMELNSLVAIGH